MLRLFFLLSLFTLVNQSLWSQHTLVKTADVDFRTGLELLDRKKFSAARYFFEKYAGQNNIDNKNIEAQYYVAYAALNLFNPDAESLFENFIQRYPYHSKASSAYYDLGTFYYNNKKYDKTIEYLEKVNFTQLSFEQSVEAKFRLGYAYFSQKDFDKAAPMFNQIKNSDHKYTFAASYYAAYVEYRNDDFTTALSDLKKAEQGDAYKNLVPLMVVNIYYKKGAYDDMLYYADNVLKKGDKLQGLDEIYMMTSEAYFKKKDYALAATGFDKYLNEYKGKPAPEIIYRLGFSQFQIRNYTGAAQNFKNIAAIKDSLGQAASYYLGLSYLKLDNKTFALSAFDQARKLNFNAAAKEEALFNYAQAAYELEKNGEAVAALKEFTKTFPKSKHSEEVQDLFSNALLQTNDYSQGIAYIEALGTRSSKVNAAYQKMCLYKGIDLFNADKFSEAILYFNKSIDQNYDKETFLGANFWKAEALSVLKDYGAAINSYAVIFQKAMPNESDFYLKSRYGIGYAYYNTQQYDNALPHFRQYINEKDKVSKQNYDDALLRMADLYFVTKQYQEAVTYYDQAITQGNPDKDYAYFQKGIVYGLQGKPSDGIASFDIVIKNYPKSLFFDDAIFQKAALDLESSNYAASILGFTRVINTWPTSGFVPYARLKRAVAYGNLERHSDAINDYKVIMNQFADHPVANNALLGLQESMTATGKTEEMAGVIAKYKELNPQSDALVNIEFDNAKALYNDQKYAQAIESLNNYAKSYPQNPNDQELKFYLAESYFRMQDYLNALGQFKIITKDKISPYYNRAIQRSAELEFKNKSYGVAKGYYQQLAAVAKNKKERSNAWTGLMESYYQLAKYDSAAFYVSQILDNGNASIDAESKAMLYQGKIERGKKNPEGAIDYFINTINQAKDENAAEAQYLIASIQFDQKNYKQSIETLYEFNNTYTEYPNWLGKSFLLLAENFLALDENFQAKATLNSIIEKSPDKESVRIATEKLEDLEIKESDGKAVIE